MHGSVDTSSRRGWRRRAQPPRGTQNKKKRNRPASKRAVQQQAIVAVAPVHQRVVHKKDVIAIGRDQFVSELHDSLCFRHGGEVVSPDPAPSEQQLLDFPPPRRVEINKDSDVGTMRQRLQQLKAPVYGTKAELWDRIVKHEALAELKARESHRRAISSVSVLSNGFSLLTATVLRFHYVVFPFSL